MKNFIDNYDCGVRFTDDNIKMILDLLKKKGLYGDDLAIIVTSDHGENLGEAWHLRRARHRRRARPAISR